MVRLEKVLYEQVVNTQALKRARVMATPSKWYNENRHDAYKVASHKVFNEGVSSTVLGMLEPFLAKFVYRWARDIANTRGMALEDFLLFQDRQLRRCFLWEAQARGSLHPYTWIFHKRRRARYYKVERGLRGFEVQDWVRKEAESRTLAETLENKETWENFQYKEYQQEQTPTARWSVLNKWNPLDMFCLYGLWRPEAFDRYFYNEAFYEGYSQEEVKNAVLNPFKGVNLNTSEGKKRFEEEVAKFQKLYPGAVTKEGEKFDFNRFYAQWSLVTGKDTSKYDQKMLSEFKQKLDERVEDGTAKGVTGTNIGSVAPDFTRPNPGKALQSN